MSRVLDALEHRVRLPPGDVVVIVKVGQPVGGMGQVCGAGVANVARLLRSFGARLRAEFTGSVQAAGVGRFDSSIESRVHEIRNASLLYDKQFVFIKTFLTFSLIFVLRLIQNSNQQRTRRCVFISIESESSCPGMDIQFPCGQEFEPQHHIVQ